MIALWLLCMGWQYRLTANEVVQPFSVREQIRHVWNVYWMSRKLIARMRQADARKAAK
jgi:hypothetical protein